MNDTLAPPDSSLRDSEALFAVDGPESPLDAEPVIPTEADLSVQLLVCPGPRFGGARATRFVREVSPLCRVKPFVVLDMGEVAAVDGAGLLAIACLSRVCRAAGGALRLCSPNSSVRRMLATAGIHRLAEAYAHRNAGLA